MHRWWECKMVQLLWKTVQWLLSFNILFIYVLIWLHQVLTAACGIYVPDQGWNPGPLHWERGVSHWATREVLVWRFLTKLNTFLPQDPASSLLGVYPKELNTLVPAKYLHVDVYSSFIHKPWYIQTAEYYSTLKRNELSIHEKDGDILNTHYQGKRPSVEKLCTFHTMW